MSRSRFKWRIARESALAVGPHWRNGEADVEGVIAITAWDANGRGLWKIGKTLVSALCGSSAPIQNMISIIPYISELLLEMATTFSTLRPLSNWKRLLRQSRQQRTCLRCLSTTPSISPQTWQPPPLPPTRSPYKVTQASTHIRRLLLYQDSLFQNLQLMSKPPAAKKIKTYPPPPSTRNKYPLPVQEWTNTHLQTLDPTQSRTRLFDRSNPDTPNVGDILLCTFRTGDPFSGVCLSIKRRGVDTGILLRNKLLTVGVEMWVKIYSPNVTSIEVVKRAEKRARRARLYYMRKPRHDRGSVEGEVEEYLKRRRLIRSGALGVKDPGMSRKRPESSRSGVGAR